MADCYCHANGCDEPHQDPGPPFCAFHWKMLPEAHRKAIGAAKWHDEVCPICMDTEFAYPDGEVDEEAESVTPGEGFLTPTPWAGAARWHELVNLATAQICMVEYGPHGCPESLLDDQGFCWGCGCSDVPNVYAVAKVALDRHGWPSKEVPT